MFLIVTPRSWALCVELSGEQEEKHNDPKQLLDAVEQVKTRLESYFGTTASNTGNVITASFAKSAHSDLVACVKRHILELKIAGITIREDS